MSHCLMCVHHTSVYAGHNASEYHTWQWTKRMFIKETKGLPGWLGHGHLAVLALGPLSSVWGMIITKGYMHHHIFKSVIL